MISALWRLVGSGKQPPMVVQRRGIIHHNLLSMLYRILMLYRRWPFFRLLIRVLIDEEILDLASTCSSLIDCKAGSKFPVRTNLYGIQHRYGKILAIVTDDVVCWPLFSHVVDHHFA